MLARSCLPGISASIVKMLAEAGVKVPVADALSMIKEIDPEAEMKMRILLANNSMVRDGSSF